MLETLSADPSCSLNEAFRTRKELTAAYRFFSNDFVTEQKILEPHLESTLCRISNQKIVALLFIVAWRVMYITPFGRQQSNIKCTELFEPLEWKSVYKILYKNARLPKTPPTLGEFIVMIAQLGGYLNRKSDLPPGPQVIWKGLKRMADYTLAWETFGKN